MTADLTPVFRQDRCKLPELEAQTHTEQSEAVSPAVAYIYLVGLHNIIASKVSATNKCYRNVTYFYRCRGYGSQ